MMYLSRLQLNTSRTAVGWASNPYRVHQRLMMACDGDSRLLFRIEDTSEGTQILIQSHVEPNWPFAFDELAVLNCPPEHKLFDLRLEAGRQYRFRLLANPTVKKKNDDGKPYRLGLIQEADQLAWLTRKLEDAGVTLASCVVMPRGLQHSGKNPAQDANAATHLAVLFEGVLQAQDPERLKAVVESGVGSAKGYGFGLLSLAPA
jgi:CRISPR system Cascade subunit CasE